MLSSQHFISKTDACWAALKFAAYYTDLNIRVEKFCMSFAQQPKIVKKLKLYQAMGLKLQKFVVKLLSKLGISFS